MFIVFFSDLVKVRLTRLAGYFVIKNFLHEIKERKIFKMVKRSY